MPEQSSPLLTSWLVFFGSGTGGLLRYWLGGLIQSWWGSPFPLGTFAVNVTGCLVIGGLAALWAGPMPIREEYRIAVLAGLIGGYTTFSSFGRESLVLIQNGAWGLAAWYIVSSVGAGLLAVWAGAALAARYSGTG